MSEDFSGRFSIDSAGRSFDRLAGRAALIAVAWVALALSGCASYVSSNVTAFTNWTGNDTPRTFAFSVSPQQQNNLENATYEQEVGQELGRYGFRSVPGNAAQYWVSLDYGVRNRTVMVQTPVFYDSFWYGPYHRFGGGFWGPGPAYVDQPYPVFSHSLTIRMTERASGNEVYRVTATTDGEQPSLVGAMPYLVRSALADFPLQNGTVREVRVPLGAPNAMQAQGAAGSGTGAAPAGSGAGTGAGPETGTGTGTGTGPAAGPAAKS
jgi:hypothetical protein